MRTSAVSPVSEALAAAGAEVLGRVVEPLDGVHIALLCTPGGFEIASLRVRSGARSEPPTERLAAMAGALMAMAGAVATEIGHPSCRRLTFETELGTVLFQAIGGRQPAILCLVIDENVLLGKALWAAGEVAAQLRTWQGPAVDAAPARPGAP